MSDKMKFETPDLTAENVAKIAELFPGVVTEGKVNFDLLRSMLGDEIYGDEAYEFTWVGKRAAIAEAGRPIRKTLRPCMEESKNWDATENLYIEGDNLDVLKLLQESYLGKVKMVYIDPPYNMGKDYIYKDSWMMDKDEYDEGVEAYDDDGNINFTQNNSTNPRFHSDWCSMMYPRLLLARNMLREDGVLFISIDDGEVSQLHDTNMNDVYYAAGDYTQDLVLQMESNIKPDRTDMDLLFGCLLEWGLSLSMPHTHEQIDGFTVHTYNDGDLIACFEERISEKAIREIAGRKPLRAVFRDSSFNSSPEKINVFEIFKLLAPNTNVRVI